MLHVLGARMFLLNIYYFGSMAMSVKICSNTESALAYTLYLHVTSI